MTYEAIIIDDEPKLREVLNIKLKLYCPEVSILDKVGNAQDAFEKINFLKPKLIFLDINMPGESGFDLIQKFDTINFEIIFVTGYNEFALDALKLSAVDYLLKPVKTQDLIDAVNKAKDRIDKKQKAERYDVLKHNLNREGDQNTKIAIPGSNIYQFVLIADIIRCEGWQKYTKIIHSDNQTIVSSYNIGVFKDMLESYGFYSCHKSHLINKSSIKQYLKEGIIIMTDDSRIPVARRRKEDFMEKVVRFLG